MDISQAAGLLASRKRGTKERKSVVKAESNRANLLKARAKWKAMSVEERKRKNP